MSGECTPTFAEGYERRTSTLRGLPHIQGRGRIIHHARGIGVSELRGETSLGGQVEAVVVEIWGQLDGPADFGLYVAISADDARATAAGLLKAADAIDGGAGKQ